MKISHQIHDGYSSLKLIVRHFFKRSLHLWLLEVHYHDLHKMLYNSDFRFDPSIPQLLLSSDEAYRCVVATYEMKGQNKGMLP
jgi:hypothetical protein